VNRNQIGAVVGSQPFGGEGLSGTGPKAGGPNYLHRFRKRAAAEAGAPSGEIVRLRDGHFSDAVKSGWASRADRIAALRKVLRGKARAAMSVAAATEYGPVDLLGPTGEGNTLTLSPRGRVLCLGPDADTLTAQVVQALAAGNSVLAVAANAPRVLSGLLGKDLPLQALDGQVDPADLAVLDVDVVAFSGSGAALRAMRQALATRDGAIIPVIAETFNPTAYAHERAVCVDTTAAGGNASLLAGSSEGGTGFSAASSGL
jgi:RHH-type proline utilization regulon transcriptional repressor/proline dehydrogenase/delta 1-pyrroline-5-carboxylate dehydrogenase